MITETTCNFRRRLTYAFIQQEETEIPITGDALTDYEQSLLELLEKVSQGTSTSTSGDGASITIKPGTLVGGKIQHDFPISRGLSYYIAPLMLLAPFFKLPLKLTAYGITNHTWDTSVDVLRSTLIPTMAKFGYEGAEIKISRRGYEPQGGGAIELILPPCEVIRPTTLTSVAPVRKIRGLAVSAKVPPQTANRLMEASRGLLTTFIPDVYVYTDAVHGKPSGKSPGYSLALVAESTEGNLWSYEMNGKPGQDPTEVGRKCAVALLAQIKAGGAIDPVCHWLVTTWSAVACSDLCKFAVGTSNFDDEMVLTLRDLAEVFGARFKITERVEQGVIEISGIGIGDVSFHKAKT